MIARRIQSIETSSSGRLFDAVASMVGLGPKSRLKARQPSRWRSAAQPGVDDRYSFHLENGTPTLLDMRPMIEEIVRDLARGVSVGLISARFHNTVAAAIVEVCRQIRHQEQLTRVCLSGGVFQNMYLLKRTVRDLDKDGFQVFLHALVPPNDGGISLGQAAIANAILRREQE